MCGSWLWHARHTLKHSHTQTDACILHVVWLWDAILTWSLSSWLFQSIFCVLNASILFLFHYHWCCLFMCLNLFVCLSDLFTAHFNPLQILFFESRQLLLSFVSYLFTTLTSWIDRNANEVISMACTWWCCTLYTSEYRHHMLWKKQNDNNSKQHGRKKKIQP